VFGGFYTVRFQLGQASGRGVMYVHDGKMLGSNSAFAHIGTYEEIGDEIAIVINTVRHNPDPNYPRWRAPMTQPCLRGAGGMVRATCSKVGCANCPMPHSGQ
jgi:hypothetical protein